VKRVERLDTATTPDGTELTLYRHDGAYSIRVDGVELMSTRRHHSEDALAERVCLPLQNTPNARVLIGGLGLGFTLRAALQSLAADAQVVIAEIVEDVITWNTNPEYALSVDALADPRVELLHGDIANVLKRSRGVFDAIMLDVDNGAESLTTSGNAQLYRHVGITLAMSALRPGGRLAYWSANDNVQFEQSLRDAGLSVEVLRIRAHATSGPWHTLFFARVD
jgi:spermidine synthase